MPLSRCAGFGQRSLLHIVGVLICWQRGPCGICAKTATVSPLSLPCGQQQSALISPFGQGSTHAVCRVSEAAKAPARLAFSLAKTPRAEAPLAWIDSIRVAGTAGSTWCRPMSHRNLSRPDKGRHEPWHRTLLPRWGSHSRRSGLPCARASAKAGGPAPCRPHPCARWRSIAHLGFGRWPASRHRQTL